jgi:FAD/FMN-containing dehydrogenase
VQGGGCTSVGVGGHLQTGGFGSFSKRFGMSAGGIVEVEMVLADGQIVVANEHVNSDLFWAVRGAGAAYGIITRATLKLHPLPETFGFAGLRVKAKSDGGYATLVQEFLRFYRDALMNPHWGEHAGFNDANELEIAMSIQGLTEKQAADLWQPFIDWVSTRPEAYEIVAPLRLVVIPAEHWWDYEYRQKHLPHSIVADDRPGGKKGAFWWSGSAREVSIYIAGYESGWLHQRLLSDANLSILAMTLVAASRVRAFEIHFNKGLAGAPPEVAQQARDLPINPVLQNAFGLVIIAGGELNVHEGLRGHEPDKAKARAQATKITQAMDLIRAVAPDAGGYCSEMSYFTPNWQTAAWGDNYARLLALKKKYDPTGLFMAHHYVGSEGWSRDGFERQSTV